MPVLLLATLFLGIYVSLSIWYKLTDRTLIGAFVSLAAAIRLPNTAAGIDKVGILIFLNKR